jgi:hypothetical protein
VTGLADAEGAHTRLALVDLADSSVTELAEGDELWHPCLWVASGFLSVDPSGLDFDSLGVYDTETSEYGVKNFRYKMEMLWRDADSATILITGSSRPWAGINPLLLTSGYAINMASPISDIEVSDSIIRNYVLPHWTKIKYIVISLDLDILYHAENSWDKYYGKIPGYKYDMAHDYWPLLSPQVIYQAAITAGGEDPTMRANAYTYRGFTLITDINGSWGGPIPEILDDTARADGTGMDTLYLNKIKAIVELAKEHDVKVIGAIFPMSPGYKNTGSFGRHGLKRSLAEKIIQRIKTYEGIYSNFRLMDENKMGNHDYSDDKAYDFDHLNLNGAAQFTYRLDSLLKTLK